MPEGIDGKNTEEILNISIPGDPITDVEIEPIINEISTNPITKAEIRTALRKIKNGKAGGKDEITAELLKADMNTTEKCKLIQSILGTRESIKHMEAGTDH